MKNMKVICFSIVILVIAAGCGHQAEYDDIITVPNSDFTVFEEDDRIFLKSNSSNLFIADNLKIGSINYNERSLQLAILAFNFEDERIVYIINTDLMEIVNSFQLDSQYVIPFPWQSGIFLSNSAEYLCIITPVVDPDTAQFSEDSGNTIQSTSSALFLYHFKDGYIVKVKFFKQFSPELKYGSMYSSQLRFFNNEKSIAVLGTHTRENFWSKLLYPYAFDVFGCLINIEIENMDNFQIYYDLPKWVLKRDIDWLMGTHDGQMVLSQANQCSD